MKVTSVEKKEYEEVMIDNEFFLRLDNGLWIKNREFICANAYAQELEAAYQKSTNPPFKITNDPEGVTLTVKGYPPIYLMSHYPIKLKEELEQALNSLMEK
jgi:hypothetical protein